LGGLRSAGNLALEKEKRVTTEKAKAEVRLDVKLEISVG